MNVTKSGLKIFNNKKEFINSILNLNNVGEEEEQQQKQKNKNRDKTDLLSLYKQ
jgi:hypothetical protein